MKDRAEMKRDAKASLIHEWDHNEERWRLVSSGKWSAGYEDKYIIEKLGADSLGEPKWSPVFDWEAGGDNGWEDRAATVLVAALKSTLRLVR